MSVECGPAVTSELYAECQIDALSLVKKKKYYKIIDIKAHDSRIILNSVCERPSDNSSIISFFL